MSQVLSQDEIDALLGGLDDIPDPDENSGSVASADADNNEVIEYDFINFTRMTRVKLPAFDAIKDQINRGFRSTLSSILRLMIDSTVAPTEVITFKEFLRRVPVPSNLHILKMEPLRGHLLLVVDPQLVFCIVEIFLGANRIGQARIEGREFTSIEQRLIRRIVNSLLSDIEKAWRPIYPLQIQYVRNEINPQFAKIAGDDDAVIITKFQIEMEEISGAITMCIPMTNLQPIKSRLQTTFQGEEVIDPTWRQELIHNIRNTEVEIVVPLGTASITGGELLDLQPGDVIQLDTNIDSPLMAMVQERTKLLVEPGLHRGQRAFKVRDFILNPDEA